MILSIFIAISLITSPDGQALRSSQAKLDFVRDIQPLLSNTCFACHGPDEKARSGGIRLDTKEGLFGQRGATAAVRPRDPAHSTLIQRIRKTGPGQMPPPGFLKRLTPMQIDLIERWVREGADYKQHWAYAPLTTPVIPPSKSALSSVDRFIQVQLDARKVKASPFADRRTLIRRLMLDLNGLPPTHEQVEAFANDRSPNAYAKLVDRVLASPHFGERLAMMWLDLVRYADTRGYHGDQHQDIYPYRDWVIGAFNANMPFDKFTEAQLAGDLRPNPTLVDRVASGYNKVLMTTEEGGSQPKEYIAKYAADRVRNVSAVWLGSTMGCAECHNHKYDPFTQKDFYSLAAFFGDVKETPVGQQEKIMLATDEQSARLRYLDARIAELNAKVNGPDDKLDGAQKIWEALASQESIPQNIKALLAVPAANRNAKQKQDLQTYFRSTVKELAASIRELADMRDERAKLDASIPRSMVAEAVAPRTLRILPRGNWLNETGEVVTPQVPAFIDTIQSDKARLTRMDLAHWLTSDRNPLTARVMVNRFWKLLFGRGIARTMEDFGAQGTRPTHPELLDYLANRFIDSGWDMKAVVREIVLSAAYKRSSVPTPGLARIDSSNDLFARQGRFRLDAEIIRDQALQVSGLLVDRQGGAPAKPYQPSGYWAYLNFPVRDWLADSGGNQYRRGVYTYWCRTFLQPSLLAFDAPTREECTSARVISNTPQQALVLMNDPTYVEASRALAERVFSAPADSPNERLQYLFQLALQRSASEGEIAVLAKMFQEHLHHFATMTDEAKRTLSVGQKPMNNQIPMQELAAWTSVARTILNLHEMINRE